MQRGGAKKKQRITSSSDGQPASASGQQVQTTHGANQNGCKGGGDSCDSPPLRPSDCDDPPVAGDGADDLTRHDENEGVGQGLASGLTGGNGP